MPYSRLPTEKEHYLKYGIRFQKQQQKEAWKAIRHNHNIIWVGKKIGRKQRLQKEKEKKSKIINQKNNRNSMKVLHIIPFLFYLFGTIHAKSQTIAGTYVGEHFAARLKINLDSTAIYSLRFETSVSFEFKCKLVKITDTTLQIENSSITKDRIIFSRKRFRNGHLRVEFFDVNRALQSRPINLSYEIQPCDTSNNLQCIRFFYNNKWYCYSFEKSVKSMTIYIDIENSFLITNWKIRGNKLIPDVNEKVNELLTLTKKE